MKFASVLLIVGQVSAIPDPGVARLGDLTLELALCTQLEGACSGYPVEAVPMVITRIERALEVDKAGFVNNLEYDMEARVGRMLCSLDYTDLCTTNNGRSLIFSSQDNEDAEEAVEEIGIVNRVTDKVLGSKMKILKAGFDVQAGAIAAVSSSIGGIAGAVQVAKDAVVEGFLNAGAAVMDEDMSGDGSGDGEMMMVDGSGSGDDIIQPIIDAKVDLFNAQAALAKASVKAVAKITKSVTKAKVQVASDAAKKVIGLAQSGVNSVYDVKLAAVEKSSNVAQTIVKSQANLFNSVFDLVKYKIDIVLCKFRVKKCMKSEMESDGNQEEETPVEEVPEEEEATNIP